MRLLTTFILLFSLNPLFAAGCLPSLPEAPKCNRDCSVDRCCGKMGGISYCDSSAGRYVCQNGFYSSCYCTRHAVMDLQRIEGCCLWQGGVLAINPIGLVICNDGGISEICSLQKPPKQVATF